MNTNLKALADMIALRKAVRKSAAHKKRKVSKPAIQPEAAGMPCPEPASETPASVQINLPPQEPPAEPPKPKKKTWSKKKAPELNAPEAPIVP